MKVSKRPSFVLSIPCGLMEGTRGGPPPQEILSLFQKPSLGQDSL